MRRGGTAATVLALTALAIWERRAQAAVAVDATLQASVFDQAEIESPNLTIGTAARRLLVVAVAVGSPTVEVGGVTWNGVALTRLEGRMLPGPGGFCHLQLWTLVEPAAGRNLLRVSLSGTAAFGLGAVSYSGVDPRAPLGPTQWTTGTGDPVALAVPAPGDRPVLAAACLAGPWTTGPTDNTPAAVVSPSETAFWNFTEPGVVGLGSHRLAMNGLGQVRWMVETVDPFAWLAVALSIKPDGEVLPDAGPDAGGDGAPGDGSTDVSGGDAVAHDAAAPADAAEVGPSAPDAAEAPDTSGTTDVRLRVGCACRAGGRDPGGAWLTLALGLVAFRRARRRG